jgi:hypothetical protein
MEQGGRAMPVRRAGTNVLHRLKFCPFCVGIVLERFEKINVSGLDA